MLIIYIAVMIDLITSVILVDQPWFAGILRPYIVGCFMKSVRLHFKALIEDLKASSVVLLSIFIFVFVYSTVLVFVYQSQYGGYSYF
jgi:hypothetical protein